MHTNSHEENLLELLLFINRGKKRGRAATQQLRKFLLGVGSASPDNLNCVEHIEIRAVRRKYHRPITVQCLKVKGRDLMVSEVIESLECAPIPPRVRKDLPGLTITEWKACLRLIVLILASAEYDTLRKRPARKKTCKSPTHVGGRQASEPTSTSSSD